MMYYNFFKEIFYKYLLGENVANILHSKPPTKLHEIPNAEIWGCGNKTAD